MPQSVPMADQGDRRMVTLPTNISARARVYDKSFTTAAITALNQYGYTRHFKANHACLPCAVASPCPTSLFLSKTRIMAFIMMMAMVGCIGTSPRVLVALGVYGEHCNFFRDRDYGSDQGIRQGQLHLWRRLGESFGAVHRRSRRPRICHLYVLPRTQVSFTMSLLIDTVVVGIAVLYGRVRTCVWIGLRLLGRKW